MIIADMSRLMHPGTGSIFVAWSEYLQKIHESNDSTRNENEYESGFFKNQGNLIPMKGSRHTFEKMRRGQG